MAETKDWREMLAWSAEILEKRTGAGVAEWNRRIRDAGMESEPQLRAWLADRGVTGYPQMLLVFERFGYPEYMTAGADQLIDEQYADRPGLRPILDRVLAVAGTVGDTQLQARKTYVSLLTPRRQFALVKPTTKRRVDLGLRLSKRPGSPRAEPARRLGNDLMTVRVALAEPDDIDDDVVEWLRLSYAENA